MIFIFITSLFGEISLDKKNIDLTIKNNDLNILEFPFIISESSLITENSDDFKLDSKGYSITILATTLKEKEKHTLFFRDPSGKPYLIKFNASSKKGTEQKFVFVTDRVVDETNPNLTKYETGLIKQDLSRILKKLRLDKKIPGFKEVKTNQVIDTSKATLQKLKMYDGGKYRAETWFYKSKKDGVYLRYEDFYKKGILLLAFEKRTLKKDEIVKMWVILNKKDMEK
jgi:hypothetical protein